MNDGSTGPLIVGMLFVVRCLIPLAILFGTSYLLQHFGLVETYNSPRVNTTAKEEKPAQSDKTSSKKKSRSTSTPKRKQPAKRKSVPQGKRSGRK